MHGRFVLRYYERNRSFHSAIFEVNLIKYLKKRKNPCPDVLRNKRGEFAELIKQNNNTQISYFTINPGQERGGHYHLTKVEKFIPISGKGIIKMVDKNT